MTQIISQDQNVEQNAEVVTAEAMSEETPKPLLNEKQAQVLYGLRFFQKKAINGGLTVYDCMAIKAIKQAIVDCDAIYGETEIKELPPLNIDSYLPLMVEFCSHKGLDLTLNLTGDIDKDLVLSQSMLSTLKSTPCTQIEPHLLNCDNGRLFRAIRDWQTPQVNQMRIIQPDIDGFSPVMAKYLIHLIKWLKNVQKQRPVTPFVSPISETPNEQDKAINPFEFLNPFKLGKKIGEAVQARDNQGLVVAEPKIFEKKFNYLNIGQGIMVYLDYKGQFYGH